MPLDTITKHIIETEWSLPPELRANNRGHASKRGAGARSMHPLVGRFQRCRWSDTRKSIDALEIGESVTVRATEFNNASTTIQRLQEAYEDTRRWRMKKVAAGWRVERVAPNGRAERRKAGDNE